MIEVILGEVGQLLHDFGLKHGGAEHAPLGVMVPGYPCLSDIVTHGD
jgi:hypothetical protein